MKRQLTGVIELVHHANAAARPSARLLLAGAAVILFPAVPAAAQEAAFRIRSDFAVPLNADAGWAGDLSEEVTVEADRPFRLRMEVAPDREGGVYALQARRNGGAWKTLEAHDFPYPQREHELSFDEHAPGSHPPGWTLRTGATDDMTIAENASARLLRATGGEGGLEALYAAPWPLPEFTFETRFRLPADSSEGFDMIFGYVDADNHGRVRLDPEGSIAILSIIDGRETLIAEEAASIARGAWHQIEIELENGQLEVNLDDDTLEITAPMEATPPGQPGIAVPRGGVVELAGMIVEGVPRTPSVSIVTAPAFSDGDRTADLLSGSAAPFAPGFGISLAERTPRWPGAGRHGEFEWPLVIRRHADGPQVNETGDRFEFRMVDSAGRAVPGGVIARVNLTIPPAHLGGTFVETPGRIGPWQATNGDLYFIMEPTETDNRFMMMKSSDGGRSWREIDGANRPETSDLEAVDSRLVGDRIHIIHQITESVHYHVFRTSDHPTHPDSWAMHDEVAAQAEAIAQTASMAVRSDESVAAFFLADRLHYVIRGKDGGWSAPVEIDPDAAYINAGPQAIRGRDDVVHLAYFSDDGRIWYRRLLPNGTLTERQRLAEGAGTSRAEYGAVLPLTYDAGSDTVIIAYRLADGTLWERRLQGGSAPTAPVMISERRVITDAVDSQQPAADLVSDGETSHVLFVDEETRSIFSARGKSGQWQMPVLRVGDINGSWVRGNIIQKPDGSQVYGYIYDAGSQGGAGLNRYAEFPLSPD